MQTLMSQSGPRNFSNPNVAAHTFKDGLQPMFSKKQAAKRFGVSARTIDHWISKGYLPYLKIGRMIRIPMSDAESWLKERCLIYARR
jgi:excisionase family DNA binding protein